jgi:hypothetical protein
MDSPVQLDVVLISKITGLPTMGAQLEEYLDNKAREKEIVEIVKEHFCTNIGNMGIVLRDINDDAMRFTNKFMACKVPRKCRKEGAPTGVITVTTQCTKGIMFSWEPNNQRLVDFSQIYGFPNALPKDEYFLRNGLKFSGDDPSLTLKHISIFRNFTKLLRVKHEDVFIGLFYDSFQGKCRSWAEGLPARSIRTITTFWVVFLETWMEAEFVEKYPSIQGFREWNNMCIDDEGNENFLHFFPLI